MNGCGGCRGQGSHRKHCMKRPNYSYFTTLAERAQSLGDSIGANSPENANSAYFLAGRLRELARKAGDDRA